MGVGGAVMDRDAIDAALRRRGEEEDAISQTLLELDDHPGRRFLDGARLRGVTADQWGHAQEQLALIWGMFSSYRDALDHIRELRQRRAKPSPAELARMSELLRDEVIEVPTAPVPLERRGLLQPARGKEWLSLDAAVKRMNEAFNEVVDIVTRAETAFAALSERLAEAEATLAAATNIARELDDPRPGALAGRLAAVRELVVADPVGRWRGGKADARDIDAIVIVAANLRDELRIALEMKRGLTDQVTAAGERLDALVVAEGEAAERRLYVRTRITAEVAPATSVVPVLRERLGEITAPPGGGSAGWAGVGERFAALEREIAAAERANKDHRASIDDLMGRRDELRGRLDAYRVKAAHLGRGEDIRLSALYREARDILWTAPCDLGRAIAAVTRYQRAISGPP
jgi:hypothetical protein